VIGPTGPMPPFSNIVVISNNPSATSISIDLSSVQSGTRYYLRYDGALTSVTFNTPLNWNIERLNWFIFIKNGSPLNVNVFQTTGGIYPQAINAETTTLRDSTLYGLANNNNGEFMYIYWNGTSLVML
jgi:hypothetical protein